MYFYRIRQFFWSVFSFLKEEDINFARNILSDREFTYFMKLSNGEKKHSIRVARDMDTYYSNFFKESNYQHKKLLIKIGLLHDIGKINSRLTSIDKSILVIMNYITNGYIRKYTSIRKVNVYYNHGDLGCEILRSLGYDDHWLNIVANHHSKSVADNKDLQILQYFDGKY